MNSGLVVDSNAVRLSTLGRYLFQDPHDIVSGQLLAYLDRQALTAMVVD